ncbi:MAG: phosphatidate cytidylyltransferase [Algisphaera sp.]
MLKHRVPSGIAMVAGLLLLIWADDKLGARGTLRPGLLLLLALLAVLLLASVELAALLRAKWGRSHAAVLYMGAAAGLVLTFACPQMPDPRTAAALFATAVAVIMLTAFFTHSFFRQEPQGATTAGASALFAMGYLGILPGLYLLLRTGGPGVAFSGWVIAAVLMTTKSCDIGAYFTGRFLGKHKLIPWLSPGKTWEGLAGGMAFSALWAVIFALWGSHLVPDRAIAWWYAAPAGLLLGFLGQVGDLLASLLKRDAGLKDWAKTIPGFGGVMDVADSVLLVAPAAYWLLTLAPKG